MRDQKIGGLSKMVQFHTFVNGACHGRSEDTISCFKRVGFFIRTVAKSSQKSAPTTINNEVKKLNRDHQRRPRVYLNAQAKLFHFTTGQCPSILFAVSISGFINAVWRKIAAARSKQTILRRAAPDQLTPADWIESLQHPTDFYLECFRFFHQRLPSELRDHRDYFVKEGRGFGEDAFHVMWFLLFREFKPKNFLEIGVFRGQTLSLAALLSRANNLPGDVCGVSPFSSAGDSVSRYWNNVDYFEDTLANFRHFKLPAPQLLRAFSTDPEAQRFIAAKPWEMIYIDGNHDYEVARQDWELCSRNLKVGCVIVLDDSGLTTTFRPPLFATGGHPGPSKLTQEIDPKQFRELLQVGHNRAFQKMA